MINEVVVQKLIGYIEKIMNYCKDLLTLRTQLMMLLGK